MNIRIYDAHMSTLGGGEKYICALAEALSSQHKVTLILDTVGRTQLEARIGHRLDTVATEYGDPYTADVVVSNVWPLQPTIGRVIQIPYGPITIATLGRKLLSGDIRGIGGDLLRKRLLARAKKEQIVLVYSQFVRNELMKHHGIDAEVLYPPVEDMASDIPKQKVILSVGRFFKHGYNVKRYDALIEAFKLFHEKKPDWSYRIVGGADVGQGHYVAELEHQAKGYPIKFYADVSHEELKKHYGEASLFWHGAGFEAKRPEDMEHFGIAVVEAMSAGCVPIVHDSGGPREIISNYSSGCVWETIDDLVRASVWQANHESVRWIVGGCNAWRRAQDFTYTKFKERALTIFREVKWKIF